MKKYHIFRKVTCLYLVEKPMKPCIVKLNWGKIQDIRIIFRRSYLDIFTKLSDSASYRVEWNTER